MSLQQAAEAALAEPITFTFELEETVQSTIADTYRPDETKPFLLALYVLLNKATASRQIILRGVESQSFRERYHFERQQKQVTLDFIYDGDGFFGHVKPLVNDCSTPELLTDLREIIHQLRM